VVAADATETGARGMDFSEEVDAQLASQRQLDIWFAEAADKVIVARGLQCVGLPFSLFSEARSLSLSLALFFIHER
jgi:hypothetical protein